jgi:hypothetical protein
MILSGCAGIDKSNTSEVIIKDGGANLLHITQAKTLEAGKLR